MLVLPKIGQGTGYNLYKNKVSKKEISYILDKGIDLGLNLIDTAENYDNGETEKIIGDVIRKKRKKVLISTKFSPENSTYKKVIQACNKSLKRLKSSYIDIYQIHWPNPKVPLEETLSALIFLKKSGKIREFGAGNFSLKQFNKAKMILKKENFFSLQTEFNIFERTIEQNGIYDFCKKHGVQIIAFSPLDQGRLYAMDQTQEALIKKISRRHNKTIAQIILAWITSKKIIIPIPMTLNLEHLRDNADSIYILLNKGELRQINNTFYSKLEFIPVDSIKVLKEGERHSLAYTSLKEAYENRLKFIPSPKELAYELREQEFVKPLRLVKLKSSSTKFKYDLISGRVRYWAWVIAYGKSKPIPAYIREHLKTD